MVSEAERVRIREVVDARADELPEADLRNTYLRGANLTGAELNGAKLGVADLSGADLSGARGLTDEQIAALLPQGCHHAQRPEVRGMAQRQRGPQAG